MKVLDKKVGDLHFCFGLPQIDIFFSFFLKKKERDKKVCDLHFMFFSLLSWETNPWKDLLSFIASIHVSYKSL